MIEVTISGGLPPLIHALNYTTDYPQDSFCTADAVDYLRKQLIHRQGDRLAAIEIMHGFDVCKGMIKGPVRSDYLLIDESKREILPVLGGTTKGYVGEGPRGAMTFDAYLMALSIPLTTRAFPQQNLRDPAFEEIILVPHTSPIRISSAAIRDIKKKALDAGLVLPSLSQESNQKTLSLEELLELLDFHHYARYEKSPNKIRISQYFE